MIMAINLVKTPKAAVKCGYTHCQKDANMAISDTYTRYGGYGNPIECTAHYCSKDCMYSAMYARD